MKARRKGTNEPFQKVASVSLCSGGYILLKDVEFEQEPNTSDHWQEQDSAMAFTLMRDIEQVSFLSKEGKDERIGWLNSLEDRFNNQESNKDHWQEVRERAAIAAMHAFCVSPSSYTGNIPLDKMAQHVVKIADALVKKLKGE